MGKQSVFQKFNQAFRNEDDCRQFLYDIKWANGFLCKRCGHTKYWKGRTRFHARCVNCDYDESVTANTIFHKIQIPLMKAFPMSSHIVNCRNGISTLDLSRLYGVDDKTAARFRLRCQDAMEAWFLDEIAKKENDKHSSIDGIILMHRGEKINGLQKIEVTLEHYSSNNGSKLVISKSTVSMADEIVPCQLMEGSYVGEAKDIRVWNFRKWMEGTHHHCSPHYIRKYEHEFYFRFNNRNRLAEIWYILMRSVIEHKPSVLYGKAA